MLLNLDRPDLLCKSNFIGGVWAQAKSGRRMEVVDPATDSGFADVPDSDAEDAIAATNAANIAFEGWRISTARQRASILKRWHGQVLANAEDLARLISHEQGKPLTESRVEVAYGASYIEWFAEEAVRVYGDVIPEPVRDRKMLVVKEPVGVVAGITPWNFPLAMIARKIAPALAAGCTTVCKPAEDTPLTALALVKLAQEAGIPPGVINIVTASRTNAALLVDGWLRDHRVRKITFTGSTAVGKELARGSAESLKRVSLELGGNSPFIVFEDADISAAVEGLVRAKFRNSGQTCVSPNRIYVHESVYKRFADQLVRRVRELKVGPATWPDAEVGPLINARAVDKVERHVRDALEQGALVLTGGHRIRNDMAAGPHYYAPTVLGNANQNMVLSREETFGPVVPLFMFLDEDDCMRQSNCTPYGLASYFYTRDLRRVWRIAERLEAGIVGINEGLLTSAAAPFGGKNDSGYGREGSRYGLDDYLHIKYICQGCLAPDGA